MRRVLCYGDSNTWGYLPGSGERLERSLRWTGVLQVKMGEDVLILEQGLNGRITARKDPFQPGRNGAETLPSVLIQNSPLHLVVIMLGTNDMKHMLGLTASDIARNLEDLVLIVQRSLAGPERTTPEVLLLSPPRLRLLPFDRNPMFRGAQKKSRRLPDLCAAVARRCRCHFLNATEVAAASLVDGVHLDHRGHRLLGEAVAEKLISLWAQNRSIRGDI